MSKSTDMPERRVKNLWAVAIAVAGLIVGIILIVRGDPSADVPQPPHTEPLRGILVILVGLVIAALFYVLNNRHHIDAKSEDKEAQEFDN
jgi:drug/metabolite transporter (DMT)-like permease